MASRIEPRDLMACGLEAQDSESLAAAADLAMQRDPTSAWREISHRILRPSHPFAVHKWLFEAVFGDGTASDGPAAAWTPSEEDIRSSNVGHMMRERGFGCVAELHAWSIARRDEFWGHMIDRLQIRLEKPYRGVLDVSGGVERPEWLCGARLNIAQSCFGTEPDKLAIIHHDEGGTVERVTYGQLSNLANRVANGLVMAGYRSGDALAIYMPMTIEAVAIYLGIIRAGCVAVSIADSLASDQIAVRLRLAAARGVFTQQVMRRGGKPIALAAKVIEAGAPPMIVIGVDDGRSLRPTDIDWRTFIDSGEKFEPYMADPREPTNILFSSGTTGEPKAIPWTHLTPIKCAVDGYLHQGIQPHDRVAWPTNLGWMMGPWLIYASLINRATMALYGGAPTGRDFGQFVQDAGVTMLGVIPSLVKTWRAGDCMRSLDWSRVRRFSSTGECSNADDMLYLMSLAGYKPVIEYCGGTELGGAYIGGTMAEPNVPAAFSTPSFGTEMVLDGDPGCDAESGEVFLVPPAVGMSTQLMHHDHHAVYFEGTPRGPQGQALRRHGDALERLLGGYYRALGRVDDTMNLGGIKVSSVEIERVLNLVRGVSETAAVACTPPGGGPSVLWVFAVPRPDCGAEPEMMRAQMQDAIREHLNPLFKIERVVRLDALPRTASHKIMRRVLRDQAQEIMREAEVR